MKRIFISLLLFLPLALQADLLTDILNGEYAPQTLSAVVPLPDGERYAVMENNAVVSYDYRTGKEREVLFDAAAETKLNKIDTLQGFLLSPNPRYLLVYNQRQQIYRRSFVADYYIYDRQRNELKPLSDSLPVATPQFSPDGRYIAFSRHNNLYIHKLDFGTEVAVTTDGKEGELLNGTPDWLYEEEFATTCLFAFSPDSKQLAFVKLDEREVGSFRWQEVLSDNSDEVKNLRYPRAGEPNAKASVVVYDTYYKSLKTIALKNDKDGYIPRIRWSNDPDKLAIFCLNRNQNKMEMVWANPKSTVVTPCYKEENKAGWIDFGMIDEWQFLQDNSLLVVSEADGYRHAYLYSATGQKLRLLTEGNYDVTRVYGLDEAKQTLYFAAATPSPMERSLWALNINKKNKLTRLCPDEGIHAASFSATYTYFIDNFSSLDTPNRYIVCDAAGKPLRTLLENDEVKQRFDALNLPRKEFFTFTTPEGDTLNGWMLKPQDFRENEQYPVLMVQYSGPESQQVLNRWRIDWEYFLSTQGIVVACVDGRGTGARGSRFRQQVYKQMGVLEARDQVYAAQYMQQLPFVDAAKIGIWGWSFGGFMTILAMSQPSSPYCCGIAVAPVTDFRLYDSAYTERFMQRPQSNEQGYRQIALPDMANQLQGRLLIVHGLTDDNVHCRNTWLYVDALVRAGKQFDMQIYPDDNHFLRKRNNYYHLYEKKTEFLNRWLKNN